MMCFGRGFPWVGMLLAAACVAVVVIIVSLTGWWAFMLLCVVMMVGSMVMMAGMSGHSRSKGETTGDATHPFAGLCGGWWQGSQQTDRPGSDDREEVET